MTGAQVEGGARILGVMLDKGGSTVLGNHIKLDTYMSMQICTM